MNCTISGYGITHTPNAYVKCLGKECAIGNGDWTTKCFAHLKNINVNISGKSKITHLKSVWMLSDGLIWNSKCRSELELVSTLAWCWFVFFVSSLVLLDFDVVRFLTVSSFFCSTKRFLLIWHNDKTEILIKLNKVLNKQPISLLRG